MSENLIDDLGGLLSSSSIGDESFKRSLSYYNSLDGVSVDSEIISVYNSKSSVATNASRIIKSTRSDVKRIRRSIEDGELNFKRSSDDLRNMVPEIRRAKKEWKDTNPITQAEASRQAHLKFANMKKNFRVKNMDRHRIKERISEDKIRLAEKEALIKENTERLDEAKIYMKRLEKGIKKQFDAVNKILAIKNSIKTRDNPINLQDPDLKDEYKTAIAEFSKQIKQNLRISISEPFVKQMPELMQLLEKINTLASDEHKKRFQKQEKAEVGKCEKAKFAPDLDDLENVI